MKSARILAAGFNMFWTTCFFLIIFFRFHLSPGSLRRKFGQMQQGLLAPQMQQTYTKVEIGDWHLCTSRGSHPQHPQQGEATASWRPSGFGGFLWRLGEGSLQWRRCGWRDQESSQILTTNSPNKSTNSGAPGGAFFRSARPKNCHIRLWRQPKLPQWTANIQRVAWTGHRDTRCNESAMNATSWSKESKIGHRNSLQTARISASTRLTTHQHWRFPPELVKLSNVSKQKSAGLSRELRVEWAILLVLCRLDGA